MQITIYENMELPPMFYPEGWETIEDIELVGNVRYESGDHIRKGYYYLDDSSLTWEQSKYTKQQNSKIKEWTEVNYSDLDQHFCDRYLTKLKDKYESK